VGATREVALCGADPATTRRLLDLFTDAVEVSAAGELADVALGVGARRTWTLADVITTGEHKTAVYSFQLPLQAGAVLGGADAATVDELGTVGRLAGVGFQLVDDLRGVFSDEAVTGKCALGDLREGKVTALVAHAAGTDAWTQLAPYIGDPDLDDEGAGVARKLLEECGSRRFVEELADSYLAAALRTARDADLAPALLDELSELCRRILLSAA
jgi:geranylgeranyl diphosphate synthase type II